MASSCEHGYEPSGHAMAEVVVRQLLTAKVCVGFVVEKVALGQVFLRTMVYLIQHHSTKAPLSIINN